jgi:hypothetical protein
MCNILKCGSRADCVKCNLSSRVNGTSKTEDDSFLAVW